jgi:hypothetical protein
MNSWHEDQHESVHLKPISNVRHWICIRTEKGSNASSRKGWNTSLEVVGACHEILPHVVNIDNRSATILICKCSLLCNNIPIATHKRNSTAPSLLWYGLINSTYSTGVLYWVRLKTSTELYVEDASVSKLTWSSAHLRVIHIRYNSPVGVLIEARASLQAQHKWIVFQG